MSYYRLAMATPSASNPTLDSAREALQSVRSDWNAVAKGRTSKQLWRAGGTWQVGGVKSSLVTFIMDAAHIVLLLAGLYVMVTAIL